MIHRLIALRWLMILGPVVFVAALSYAAYFYLPAFFPLPILYTLVVLTAAAALLYAHFLNDSWAAHEREITQHQRELTALNRVGTAASSSLELTEILSRVLDAVLELTHAGAGRVWLVEADSSSLKNVVHRGLFPEAFEEPAVLKLGEGTAGQVAATAQAKGIPDLNRETSPELAPLRAKGFVQFASVPLVAKDRVVGVVEIAARHSGDLASSSLDLLTSIGREVGLAIENAHLYEAARVRQAEAESLYKAGIDVSSKLDLAQVLNTVTERGRALLNVDAAALCLWDAQERWLVVGSKSGPAEAFESPGSLGRRVAQRIGVLRVDVAHQGEDCLTCALIRGPFRRTHVEIPVRVADQVIGCLCVSSARPRTFGDREVQVLGGLADQAAIAIQNARAYDRASNTAISIERERLAREMHDTLAQVLGFVNTKSQAARELLEQNRVDEAHEQIDQLISLSQELYADVREVILGLRTAISPEKSLLPALAGYVESYSKQSGINTRLVVEDGAGEIRFAPAVELQLIRIVQESLTNIRKHARADHAIVRFSRIDGHAEMRIEDDGHGFDPGRIARGDWPQFGLQTMRERAESVGGAFVVVSQPGVGAQIIVQVPLSYAGGR